MDGQSACMPTFIHNYQTNYLFLAKFIQTDHLSCLNQANNHFRVTIVKDKVSRESKGVAFILFLDRDSAQKAVTAINQKQV